MGGARRTYGLWRILVDAARLPKGTEGARNPEAAQEVQGRDGGLPGGNRRAGIDRRAEEHREGRVPQDMEHHEGRCQGQEMRQY